MRAIVDDAVGRLAVAAGDAMADYEDRLRSLDLPEEQIEIRIAQYRAQIGAWLLSSIGQLTESLERVTTPPGRTLN